MPPSLPFRFLVSSARTILMCLVVGILAVPALAQFPVGGGAPSPGGMQSPGGSRAPGMGGLNSRSPSGFGNRANTRGSNPTGRSRTPGINSGRGGAFGPSNPGRSNGLSGGARTGFSNSPTSNIPGYSRNRSNRHSPAQQQFGAIKNPFGSTNPHSVPVTHSTFGRPRFDPSSIGRVKVGGYGANPFSSIKRGNNNAQSQIDKILNNQRSLGNLIHATNTANQLHLGSARVRQYRSAAMDLARQQINSGPTTSLPYVAMAKFSLEDNKFDQFQSYTRDLRNQYPKDKYTRFFSGIESLKKNDWKRAEKELLAARAAGIPEKDLAGYLKLAIDNQKWIWEYGMIVGSVLFVWLLGMAILYLIGGKLSKNTLETIESGSLESFEKQKSRNRFYRFIVWFAGLYYYISLPLVIVLAVALPLALAYGALSLSFISLPVIGIVATLGIGGIVTAVSGFKASLTPMKQLHHEYRKVGREEAPKLWALTDEVAEKVGTRAVDEIWVLPSVALAVTEQGTLKDKFKDKATRVLVMGLGAIKGMDQASFRAIVAHEYGHFQNRDTAGGDISMRVNGSMSQFVDSIVERGKIRWWDVAVKFLQTYSSLFNRISFGAMRLQEVMADRVAVESYGAKSFTRGLSHVIRRDLESQFEFEKRIKKLTQVRDESIPEEPDRFSPFEREQLCEVYEQALKAKTDEFDTHPSPGDRFRMAGKVLGQGKPVGAGLKVTSLFEHPNELVEELDSKLDRAIRKQVKLENKELKSVLTQLSNIPHTNVPQVLFEKAAIAADLGRFEEAIGYLDKLIASQGDAYELKLMKAAYQRRGGELDGCIKTLKEVELDLSKRTDLAFEELDAMKFQLFIALGKCYSQAGQHKQACGVFEKACNINPDSFPSQFLHGKAELEAGRLKESLHCFDNAIEINDRIPEPHFYRGNVLEKAGHPEKASVCFKRAASLDPIDPRFRRKYMSTKIASKKE